MHPARASIIYHPSSHASRVSIIDTLSSINYWCFGWMHGCHSCLLWDAWLDESRVLDPKKSAIKYSSVMCVIMGKAGLQSATFLSDLLPYLLRSSRVFSSVRIWPRDYHLRKNAHQREKFNIKYRWDALTPLGGIYYLIGYWKST